MNVFHVMSVLFLITFVVAKNDLSENICIDKSLSQLFSENRPITNDPKMSELPKESIAFQNSPGFSLAKDLYFSEFAAIISKELDVPQSLASPRKGSVLPLVFLHGMGDSCFNSGMKSIAKESGVYMNVYSVCIPTGDSWLTDTLNGFLMDMNTNVDVFAEKVKSDPNLSNGFNCIGLSQGNNICRGYIQRYNSPLSYTHISVHGPVVGVASLPSCNPDSKFLGSLCRQVDNILGKAAYNEKVQGALFQADYFREPLFTNSSQYKDTSQLASWNNEGSQIDETIKNNFGLTKQFAMIKADGDTVVIPNEGEWWGAYDDGFHSVLPMKETPWYIDDLFGLRTADEAGKILFNTTEGNHLDFSTEELFGWLDLYAL